MKSLKQYILEEFKEFRVKDLVVNYFCMPNQEYIKFHVPVSYSENDFLIYIGDKYFNDLPASDSNMQKYFGANANDIYDVLFEYDTYEKGVDGDSNCVEWDLNLDNRHNPENEEFVYVKVKGLRYVIRFDQFDMKDATTVDPKGTLIKIFKSIEANNSKFPLELKLDEKNIKFTE